MRRPHRSWHCRAAGLVALVVFASGCDGAVTLEVEADDAAPSAGIADRSGYFIDSAMLRMASSAWSAQVSAIGAAASSLLVRPPQVFQLDLDSLKGLGPDGFVI